MTERPILYTGQMVQAILEDRKTMTWRLNGLKVINESPDEYEFLRYQDYPDGSRRAIFHDGDKLGSVKFPFGKIGNQLWVRETFMPCAIFEKPIYLYKADGPECYEHIVEQMEDQRWVPSIFMPREASRITLEITDFRVERLYSITPSDAHKEGREEIGALACLGFFSLWDKIHGAGAHELNPWVWAIEFKRIKP